MISQGGSGVFQGHVRSGGSPGAPLCLPPCYGRWPLAIPSHAIMLSQAAERMSNISAWAAAAVPPQMPLSLLVGLTHHKGVFLSL